MTLDQAKEIVKNNADGLNTDYEYIDTEEGFAAPEDILIEAEEIISEHEKLTEFKEEMKKSGEGKKFLSIINECSQLHKTNFTLVIVDTKSGLKVTSATDEELKAKEVQTLHETLKIIELYTED